MTGNPYLVDLREEASSDKLCAEVLPEFQFADGGAEWVPAVGLAVGVCGLAEQRGTDRFRSLIYLTHLRDLICNKKSGSNRDKALF